MSRAVRVAAALAVACLASAARADEDAGVVVVAVSRGQVADRAGLRAGDALLRWECFGASGALRSPFDLVELEREQGPRGPVTLFGRRGTEPLSWALFPDEWGLEARPPLGERDAAAYDAARRARETDGRDAAVATLNALRAGGAALPDVEPWLLQEVARVEQMRRRPDAAVEALEQAAALAHAAGRPAAEAQLLEHAGAVLREAERAPQSSGPLERALALRERTAPGSLAAAALAEPLKIAAVRSKAERQRLLEDAIARLEREAPDSLALVRNIETLGWLLGGAEQSRLVGRAMPLAERHGDSLALARLLFAAAWNLGDTERPIALMRRALAIQQRLAPETAAAAVMGSFLGRYLEAAGEPETALAHQREALALAERVAPGTADHGHVLNNLGLLWLERGDLFQAEPLYRQALAIEERREPEGFGVARMLHNLGLLAGDRRELDEAERLFERAYALTEKHQYGPGLGGRCLSHLAEIRRARGDLAGAERIQRQALARLEVLSPGQVANARRRLADTLTDAGRYAEAAALYAASLETAAGYPVVLAERTHALGAMELKRGDLDAATRSLGKALELRRRFVPGTTWHAESSHAMGMALLRRGQPEAALALLEEAVAALEAQGFRLGGSEEARARFRASYRGYYRDLEDLLIGLGRVADAFTSVERSRARGLPMLLADRDLPIGGSLPAELERDRRRADRRYDLALSALQSASEGEEGLARLGRSLADARRAQEEVRALVRAAAPRRAALRDPEPLDLERARGAVGPGALVLVYSLAPRDGRLYALGPGPLELAAFDLPTGADGLREEVRVFREAIDARRSRLESRQLAVLGRRLAARVLAPVGDRLARADRVVVVPDGPLHLLPFGALPDPADAAGGRYLVESKAVEVVSSLTLYATLARAEGGRPPRAAVVGFGDPLYPPSGDGVPAAAARALRSRVRLDRLQETRRELDALRMIAPDARIFEGADATEERAKAVGRDTRYAHFACHAFLDEAFPLESGLVLSTPRPDAADGENGILQAWEVFDAVRLDADLVTLSACQTGLGAEMGGEGLLGLTWAFQYAGARSVLASLWEVDDASTATLMTRFYRHLAGGVPRAEALRRAQVDLLRRRTTAAPYFWAGFTLAGDGR